MTRLLLDTEDKLIKLVAEAREKQESEVAA